MLASPINIWPFSAAHVVGLVFPHGIKANPFQVVWREEHHLMLLKPWSALWHGRHVSALWIGHRVRGCLHKQTLQMCVPDHSSYLLGGRAASLMWHKSSLGWSWNWKFSTGANYYPHRVLGVQGAIPAPREHCLLMCIAWRRSGAPGAFQGGTLLVLPASQLRQLKLHRNLLFYFPHSPVIGADVPRARD